MGAQDGVQRPLSEVWARRVPVDAGWGATEPGGQPLGRVVLGLGRPEPDPALPSLCVPLACLGGEDQAQQGWWGGAVQSVTRSEHGSGLRLHQAHSADFLWACVEVHNPQNLEQQGRAVYELLLQTVQARGKPQLLKLWNYLPHITAVADGEERYQSFNRGRRLAFEAAGRSTAAGAPAACALGTRQGVLQVAVLAGRCPVLAIENPRQVSAYHYPREYGAVPPLFSRAAWLTQASGRDLLLISGTASIVGHATMHVGDVRAQTQESLRNIEAVLQSANAKAGASLWRLQDLSGCVYVRHAADYDAVRGILEGRGLHRFCYLEADVCRADLLVEIEAEAQIGSLPEA